MSSHYYASLGDITYCEEIYNSISKRLCEIDSVIEYVEINSSDLINEDVEAIVSDLQKTKNLLLNSIHTIKNQLHDEMEYNESISVKEKANELLKESYNVTSVRMLALKTVIQEALEISIKEQRMELNRIVAGGAIKRDDLDSVLKSIDDGDLRNMVRFMARNPKHNSLTSDELLNIAEKALMPENVSRKIVDKTKDDISKKLKARDLDSNQIELIIDKFDDSTTISEMETIAEEAIISEKLRKRAVKAIVENITDKGFLVNRKNIRTIKDTNTVRILAVKPGGQRAEFKINLDGSFIYKFDEYVGQACQKDIEPFIEDLNSIYGIQVYDIKEMWSNPDKESSQKYQSYKVNRGGN